MKLKVGDTFLLGGILLFLFAILTGTFISGWSVFIAIFVPYIVWPIFTIFALYLLSKSDSEHKVGWTIVIIVFFWAIGIPALLFYYGDKGRQADKTVKEF